MDSKRTWIIAGIFILAIGMCLCGLLIFLISRSGWIIRQFGSVMPTDTTLPTSTQTAIPLPDPTTEATPFIPFTETPPPTETTGLDLEILEQMDEIEVQVMDLRGLWTTGPVPRSLLTKDELRQRVMEDFLADYTEVEAQDDVRVLALLGLLEPEFDLLGFYLELYSEQVAGYYDDEAKEMFVVQDEGFKGPERLTYAHEFTHVLQDQIYDFQEGLNYTDEFCEAESERCAALQAVIEGDATYLEEQWLRNYATPKDIMEILDFVGSYSSPVYDSAPDFMQEDFLFPYTYGTDFVREIHFEGGWAAVDALYANPPVSTEQILHPDRFPGDLPILLEAPDLEASLGGDWREIEHNVLGEWYTRLTLDEYVEYDLAVQAAEGWGGDYYVALYNDENNQGAFVLMTVWDRVKDAEEFYLTFEDYGENRFGSGSISTLSSTWASSEGHVLIERWGNQTLWILAPGAQELENLRGAIEFPPPGS